MKHMTEQNTPTDFPISADKCGHCENLVPLEEIDPNYEGVLATYKGNRYCTIKCLEPQDEE